MLVTGLRSRFFITITIVLFALTISSAFLYSLFLKQERLALIDHQVRETAAALVDSELGDLRKIDFELADEIISDELGESRIGKFFIIRSSSGKIIFESTGAQLLPINDVPSDKQWFEIIVKEKYIRGLNLQLPRIPDRTLQVGLVLDEQLVMPNYFSKATLTFAVILFIVGLGISFFFTSFLLYPIARLDKFLGQVIAASKAKNILPTVPDAIADHPSDTASDEFKRLVANLNSLILKVNKNYELSRLWSYQMAHELKTPLTMVQIEIEKLQTKLGCSKDDFSDLTKETKKVSETIDSFLGWAELENSSNQKHLFMNNLNSIISDNVKSLSNLNGQFIFEPKHDIAVAANPNHLNQLVKNLLINSIRHTPENKPIVVSISAHAELMIADSGPEYSTLCFRPSR
ncbi:MAG: HAMP domain-containing histidine kinase [Bdellovibrionaceae bacterium]|nr:HAMP domain-containing histidine kinase [Pseudobdellovibrionaceae bacterium]